MPEDTKFPLTDALEALLGLHPLSWMLKEYAKETIRKLAVTGNRDPGWTARWSYLGPFSSHPARPPRCTISYSCPKLLGFHHITVEKATRLVRETDEARCRYVQSYFGADVDDPLHYYLVINSDLEAGSHSICDQVR
jgi:hypothetical protein